MSQAEGSALDAPQPVTGDERIESLDVLRGFAVLGILVMNIQSFSMVDPTYFNPTVSLDLTGANLVVWWLSHLLVDSKFMAIFSILFGAGIVVILFANLWLKRFRIGPLEWLWRSLTYGTLQPIRR